MKRASHSFGPRTIVCLYEASEKDAQECDYFMLHDKIFSKSIEDAYKTYSVLLTQALKLRANINAGGVVPAHSRTVRLCAEDTKRDVPDDDKTRLLDSLNY